MRIISINMQKEGKQIMINEKSHHPEEKWAYLTLHGFTLVELLVVIAIISVLAGMLLPVLQNAREAALQIECMQQLKQVGLSVNMYDNDNHSPPLMIIPSAYSYSGGASTWARTLIDTGYVTNKDIMFCRSNIEKVYNQWYVYGFVIPVGVEIVTVYWPSGASSYTFNYKKIRLFSNTPMFADSMLVSTGSQYYYVHKDPGGGTAFHLRHPGLTTNVQLLDGHVKAYNKFTLLDLSGASSGMGTFP